jgi:hypothetical protein
MSELMAGTKHEPTDNTRKTVESMAGFGIPQPDIAAVIGVCDKTLRKHYRDELDLGATKANAQVIANLYKHATGSGKGSVTAAIFWCKTRCGWKEKFTHEHAGPDGQPIPAKLQIEFVKSPDGSYSDS